MTFSCCHSCQTSPGELTVPPGGVNRPHTTSAVIIEWFVYKATINPRKFTVVQLIQVAGRLQIYNVTFKPRHIIDYAVKAAVKAVWNTTWIWSGETWKPVLESYVDHWKYMKILTKNNLQSLIVFISLVHWHMSSVHAIFVNILRHFASFRLALQGTPSRILRSCQKYRPKAGEVHHDKPGIQNSRSQVVLTWNFRRCQADFRRKQYPFRAIGKFYSQDIRTKTG